MRGGLTLRILAVNVLPLLVLIVGLISLGRYQENLITEHLRTLQERAQNFAVAIEGPDEREPLLADQARKTIRKLGEKRQDTRIRLFDLKGRLLADSHQLGSAGDAIQVVPLEASGEEFNVSRAVAYLGTELLDLLPTKAALPVFPETSPENLDKYPDVRSAMRGRISATAWDGGPNNVILTAAAPIIKNGHAAGVLLLTNDGADVEKGMDRVRFDILTAALAALSITIFLSIYLAGVIGQPLQKLAAAAEKIRQSKGRQVSIPDMSHRRDEIGELSRALRDMTQALWDRMDSIERFAADVAHEIKNPLTSLRSAVETAAKVTDPQDRARLLDIIQHDVQRLDRLISDISKASRLDAELLRDERGPVDLRRLLENLVDAHKNPMERGVDGGHSPLRLEIARNFNPVITGNEGRLAQVFENLISNALSFSPPGGAVTIRIMGEHKKVRVEIEDEGPGIPEGKLDDIFERFYSERPKGEAYGKHSGLGLSIARQIIIAHNGTIFAGNVRAGGAVKGACFTVVLDRAG